jgi:hypothetical protein
LPGARCLKARKILPQSRCCHLYRIRNSWSGPGAGRMTAPWAAVVWAGRPWEVQGFHLEAFGDPGLGIWCL